MAKKTTSKKYSLNKEDGLKILKGAGIATGGALLTYILQVVANVDFGEYTPVVVAISGILVNAARKWLATK